MNDVLRNLVAELKAKDAHWLEAGAGRFTADDLVAAGKALCGKLVRGAGGAGKRDVVPRLPLACAASRLRLGGVQAGRCTRGNHPCLTERGRSFCVPPCLAQVGEVEHAGSLFLLNAQSNTSMLDFVVNSFDIKDSHHVHHRCGAAGGAALEGSAEPGVQQQGRLLLLHTYLPAALRDGSCLHPYNPPAPPLLPRSVYVCMPAGTAHTVDAGSTTVVNATAAQASGKLTVRRGGSGAALRH